jgi:uncharacterized membrane protein
MNKQTYINDLTVQLKARNVDDIDEIVSEYDEHFTRKMADGYTEAEIAAKLGTPKEIALQFAAIGSGTEKKSSGRFLSAIGAIVTDIFVVPFFIIMYAWLAVIGATTVASALFGICLLVRPLLPPDFLFIPPMPYVGGALMGAMTIAFGALAAVATVYCGALTFQMGKSYRRWHKNAFTDGKYPPYAIHPILKDHLRRRIRSIGLISLLVFGASFVIGFIVLSASAGSLGFWHVWNWFV